LKRVYFGWWLVALVVVMYTLVAGATFGSFGLYILPVSAELRLSRADMNTGLILMNLGVAVLAPLMGRSLDRLPIRRIMIACALLFGVSFLVLGLSRQLWLSSLILLVGLPVCYLGAGSLTASVLLARWFSAHRGRAMALSGLGMFFGNIVVAPVIGWIIEHHGWRAALFASGAALTVLLLPLGFIVRERPGPDDIESTKDVSVAPPSAQQAAPAKVTAVLRSPQFWSISLGAGLGLGVAQTVIVSLVPLAREGGLSMMQATSLVSLVGGGAITGSLLLGVVADKVDRVVLLTFVLLAGGLVNAALMSGASYPLLAGSAAVLGLSTGVLTPTLFALLADRFGAASFGTVRGLTIPLIMGLAMIGIRFSGEVFDRTGGYGLLFRTFVAVELAAAALMFSTRFVRRPAPGPASSVRAG
jgi:MFS family permease